MLSEKEKELTRKNARMGLIVLGVVATMLAVSFAAVPLYRLFCQVTGFGGTTMVSDSLPGQILDREMTIRFSASTNRAMPWNFKPDEREIKIKVGERGITAFTAHNPTSKSITGTAIYNVTPLKLGKYFHKIQCFCFDEQTLKPGERISMPVMFYVDPAINDDPNMSEVRVITLSYTFFKAESKELEDALEGFYNDETNAIESTN